MIMLLSNNNVGDLENPDELKRIQRNYLVSLSNYLRDHYPDEASERLRDSMKMAMLSQKFYQLHLSRFKDL